MPTATSRTDVPVARSEHFIAMTTQPHLPEDQIAARRASARRTALLFAGIALAFYVGFLVLNVVMK